MQCPPETREDCVRAQRDPDDRHHAVMLIIFMVSQPALPDGAGYPCRHGSSRQSRTVNQIVLELTADGGYAINTQPVPVDQLDTQMHAIFDARPAKLLFVKSAPTRIYQDVIDAMDIARGAGVQVIGFTPADAEAPKK